MSPPSGNTPCRLSLPACPLSSPVITATYFLAAQPKVPANPPRQSSFASNVTEFSRNRLLIRPPIPTFSVFRPSYRLGLKVASLPYFSVRGPSKSQRSPRVND